MFKRLFSLNNPLGIALTAAAIILSLSPEARRGTRKALVKGAAALLSVGDQVKMLTLGARKELGTIVADAKVEKEQMALPDFSDMMKNVKDTTKSKYNQVFDDMKLTKEKTPHAMEISEELMDHTINQFGDEAARKAPVGKKTHKKAAQKNKNHQATGNVQNVLSDKAFNSMIGKPPIQN
ncbi:hypothetical protein CU633_04070 [Bacillus sp. V3-13]|uniref:hypothetical protein n=1 Tax=Bacillus sp. V3-13 TaxID=2053728 RepID=UPI000C7927E2|nr:hypothetical protein [Bacillus sp. V3-13]PLR78733.1 hypothetical protein CU633_04070 [Bacillus sp. V3-13]